MISETGVEIEYVVKRNAFGTFWYDWSIHRNRDEASLSLIRTHLAHPQARMRIIKRTTIDEIYEP